MHSIRIDRINRLVEQRVGGVLDVAEMEEAGAAMRRAVQSLRLPAEGHRSLFDCTAMGTIGDDAIANAFQQWSDPRHADLRARRVALIVPSALMRLRLAEPSRARDNMAIFATRFDAMRWLFA